MEHRVKASQNKNDTESGVVRIFPLSVVGPNAFEVKGSEPYSPFKYEINISRGSLTYFHWMKQVPHMEQETWNFF